MDPVLRKKILAMIMILDPVFYYSSHFLAIVLFKLLHCAFLVQKTLHIALKRSPNFCLKFLQ